MIFSTTDEHFLATAEQLIAEQPETLVLLRYAYCAGGRDFLLINSIDTFRSLLADPPGRMHIAVYRGHQLPLHGVVDDGFIQQALAFIADKDEFLILCLDHQRIGEPTRQNHPAPQWIRQDVSSLDYSGDTHEDLREYLDDLRGERVAVGLWPHWPDDDPDSGIEAYVPDPDGVARGGAY